MGSLTVTKGRGLTVTKGAAPRQILAVVDPQVSFTVQMAQAAAVTVKFEYHTDLHHSQTSNFENELPSSCRNRSTQTCEIKFHIHLCLLYTAEWNLQSPVPAIQ